jgi:hypothetical protein
MLTCECLLNVDQLEVLKDEVLRIAIAATASVWSRVRQKNSTSFNIGMTYGNPLFTPVHLCCRQQGRTHMGMIYLRLDVGSVLCIMSCDVSTSHILNRLELAVHLTDASKRNSRSPVEVAIFDEDICRVCLRRNGIIAIVYGPPTEGDVVGIDCVTAIGVLQNVRSVAHSLTTREQNLRLSVPICHVSKKLS